MRRRFLLGPAVTSLVFLSGMSLTAQAQAAASPGPARQADYLFFLPEVDRLQARDVALGILAQIDAQEAGAQLYGGIYQSGADILKGKFSENIFVERIQKYRSSVRGRPLRVLQGVEGGFRFLPNYPDGQYAIVVFDSIFGGTRPSGGIYTEQITLTRDSSKGGAWELLDYYMALKPFYKY